MIVHQAEQISMRDDHSICTSAMAGPMDKQFVIAHELGQLLSSSSIPSIEEKRISDAKPGVLIVDQVKPTIPKRIAVRFHPLKGKGVK